MSLFWTPWAEQCPHSFILPATGPPENTTAELEKWWSRTKKCCLYSQQRRLWALCSLKIKVYTSRLRKTPSSWFKPLILFSKPTTTTLAAMHVTSKGRWQRSMINLLSATQSKPKSNFRRFRGALKPEFRIVRKIFHWILSLATKAILHSSRMQGTVRTISRKHWGTQKASSPEYWASLQRSEEIFLQPRSSRREWNEGNSAAKKLSEWEEQLLSPSNLNYWSWQIES